MISFPNTTPKLLTTCVTLCTWYYDLPSNFSFYHVQFGTRAFKLWKQCREGNKFLTLFDNFWFTLLASLHACRCAIFLFVRIVPYFEFLQRSTYLFFLTSFREINKTAQCIDKSSTWTRRGRTHCIPIVLLAATTFTIIIIRNRLLQDKII